MRPEQREALDRLRWHSPGPAERARLKRVLRIRRTREETIALALELLAAGRVPGSIADELGVTARYLSRLLHPPQAPPDLGLEAASEAAPNGSNVQKRHRPTYSGDALAYDFESALEGAL
jgi:hypothetical protein